MEFTLLFAVLTSGVAMFVTGRVLSRRLDGTDHPIDTLLGAAIMGLFAGRIAAMITHGVNPLTNVFEIVLVRAGVETTVAAPAAVLALAWTWRRDLPRALDAVAPVAVAGVAGWHAGCAWRGACLGTVSDLPWGLALPGSNVTRHPVEVYAALGMLMVAVIVTRFPSTPWLATGSSLAGVSAVRLLTEPLRPSLTGGPTAFYFSAILIGLAMVAARGRLPVVHAVDRSPSDITGPP